MNQQPSEKPAPKDLNIRGLVRFGYITKEVAKQIRALVRQDVIGAQERYETPPGNNDRIVRNEMRDAQTKALEDL